MSLFLGIVEQLTINGEMNTFIGGKASTLYTPALLAQKLSINERSISKFNISGNDIQARIEDNYTLTGATFFNDNAITHFICTEGRCNSSFHDEFRGSSIEIASFTASAVNGPSFFRDCTQLKTTYIYGQRSRVGSSTINNSVFLGTSGVKIYCHPDIQTCNAGSPDGDITDAINNRGASVVYVQNLTAPNPIGDLSVGNVTGNTIQITFSTPTSVNTIDYFALYVNGVYKKKVKSGEYITGFNLDTTYALEVKTVDIYYNQSTSNKVSQKTNTTEPYPVSNLVSYYKMQNNVLDSFGTNNGSATAITYSSGAIGQSAVFNGTSSTITFGNNANLQFSNNFSIILHFRHPADSSYRDLLRKAKVAQGTYNGWDIIKMIDNKLRFEVLTGTNVAKTILSNSAIQSNVDTIAIFTMNAGVLTMDINNVLQNNTLSGVVMTPANLDLMRIGGGGGFFNNGQISEIGIFNTPLSAAQKTEVYNKLNSGQSLI